MSDSVTPDAALNATHQQRLADTRAAMDRGIGMPDAAALLRAAGISPE